MKFDTYEWRWNDAVEEPTSGPNVDNIDAHVQDYVISNNNRWRDVPNDWTALIDGVFQPSGFVCEKGKMTSLHLHTLSNVQAVSVWCATSVRDHGLLSYIQ